MSAMPTAEEFVAALRELVKAEVVREVRMRLAKEDPAWSAVAQVNLDDAAEAAALRLVGMLTQGEEEP